MAFERRNAGQPVRHSATEINAWNDAAVAHRANQLPVTEPARSSLPPGMALIKNNSGGDRTLYDCLAIDGALIEHDKADYKLTPAFSGITPDPEMVPKHRSRVVVLAEPIRSGKTGRGWLRGQFAMTIDVLDVEHTRARVLDNRKLQSGFFGPVRILHAPDTGAARLCRVDMDGHDGGHCWVEHSGINAGSVPSPSVKLCRLAWPIATGHGVQSLAAGNDVRVVHYGGEISAGFLQCRLVGGRIVPDVEYCE